MDTRIESIIEKVKKTGWYKVFKFKNKIPSVAVAGNKRRPTREENRNTRERN